MSTITKIFVVINLLMAGTFLTLQAMLFSFKVDYKAQHNFEQRLRTALARKLEAVQDIRSSEVGALQRAYADVIDALNAEKAKRSNVEASLKSQEEQNKTLQTNNQTLSSRLEKGNTEITSLAEQVEKYLAANKQLTANFHELNDKFHLAQNMNARLTQALEDTHRQLLLTTVQLKQKSEELHEKNAILTAMIERGVNPVEIIGDSIQDKYLRGKVMAIKGDLAMLSLGSEDGITKGMIFLVYRGSNYIGKIQVQGVFNKMCSAEVMHAWLKPGEKVRAGDDVATRP